MSAQKNATRTSPRSRPRKPELVQASSITNGYFGRVGNWWRGRWGSRGSFTAWQLMPPWRRVACHILPVIVAALFGVAVVMLIGDRYRPRIILDVRVVPDVVAPGQSIEIVYTALDKRKCHGTVHRWIIDKDSRLYALPDVSVFYNYDGLPPSFEFVRDITVPPSMPDGGATYHAETDRWCNPLQQYIWPIHDENNARFTVKRGAPSLPAPAPTPGRILP